MLNVGVGRGKHCANELVNNWIFEGIFCHEN